MPRKIESSSSINVSLLIIVILILALIFYITRNNKTIIITQPTPSPVSNIPMMASEFNGNILFNPMTPPLKDNAYLENGCCGLRINQPTQGGCFQWKQVGILTRINGHEMILPLMGKPLINNRDKWQYYTISDQNNQLKLPVAVNGKSCTSDYGCKEIYNGDLIYVEGYNDSFRATIYENNTPRYIPYI